MEASELEVLRPKHKIRSLFRSLGYELDDRTFEEVFETVAAEGDTATILAFREALDNFLSRQ